MKPDERKLLITNAAIKRFATHGYHATQVSDILEEANIARGTFYLYFKSKHDIFQGILDDFMSHVSAQIKNVEIGTGVSPAIQMRGNIERVVDAILERPEIGKIIFNEAVGLDKEIDEKLKLFYSQFIKIIESSIRRGISLGLIKCANPTAAACIILGGFRELLVQQIIFDNKDINREATINGLIDLFLAGICEKTIV